MVRKKDKKLKYLPVPSHFLHRWNIYSCVLNLLFCFCCFPNSTWRLRDVGLWLVCNISSLPSLPPHTFPLLWRGSFPLITVLWDESSPSWVLWMDCSYCSYCQKFAPEWALHRLQCGYFFLCGPLQALEGNTCSTLGFWRISTLPSSASFYSYLAVHRVVSLTAGENFYLFFVAL